MNIDARNRSWTHSRESMKRLLIGAPILAAITLFSAFFIDRMIVNGIERQIQVGMSEAELIESVGPPQRTTLPGQPVDPPHVSGWVPPSTKTETILAYFMYRLIIYVYLNPAGEVTQVFVRSP